MLEDFPAPARQGSYEEALIETAADRHLSTPLEDIPLNDLLDLYESFKTALPPHKLQDIDLAQELVLQFMRVKELQVSTLADKGTPANQKAQVANSVAGILAQLTKLQTELHTAERLKLMESNLIKVLKDFPDLSETFLAEYERSLETL